MSSTALAYLVTHLGLAAAWHQLYRVTARRASHDGATTIILQTIAALTLLLCVPLFPWQLPTSIWPYVITIGFSVFESFADRLQTMAYRHVPASQMVIIGKTEKMLITVFGIVLLGEPLIATKLIGAGLIFAANFIALAEGGWSGITRYQLFAFLAKAIFAVNAIIEIDVSTYFNIPLYIAFGFGSTAALIAIAERPWVAIRHDLTSPLLKWFVATGVVWGIGHLAMIRAYQLGGATTIAPLLGVSTILTVISAALFLGERQHLTRKLIAAALTAVGVWFIA